MGDTAHAGSPCVTSHTAERTWTPGSMAVTQPSSPRGHKSHLDTALKLPPVTGIDCQCPQGRAQTARRPLAWLQHCDLPATTTELQITCPSLPRSAVPHLALRVSLTLAGMSTQPTGQEHEPCRRLQGCLSPSARNGIMHRGLSRFPGLLASGHTADCDNNKGKRDGMDGQAAPWDGLSHQQNPMHSRWQESQATIRLA